MSGRELHSHGTDSPAPEEHQYAVRPPEGAPPSAVSAKGNRWTKGGIWLLVAAILVSVPLMLGDYRLLLANMMLINGIAVLGLVPLLGWSGQFAFISSVFMGVGAYTGGRILYLFPEVPLEAGLLIGMVGGLAIGLLFGLLAIRVKGYYLAVVTISFMFVFQMVAREGGDVTGGLDGYLIPTPKLAIGGMIDLPDSATYFIGLALTALVLGFVLWLRRTPLARGWAALSVDERHAQAVGVNPYWSRLWAFVIASGIFGLAGAWFAVTTQFVEPNIFGFHMMMTHFVFLIVGGVKSPVGAWASAIALTWASEYIRSLMGISEIVYGVALLVAVLVMRRGIAGVIEKFTKTRERWV